MIIMTSHKKVPVSKFWSCVIYAWPWCICPKNFAQIALSNSELLTFSDVNWPFWRVDSAVFVFSAKFGSNICYSHRDRRTYASDIHFMTSRELTSGFRLLVTWSSPHGRDASSHKIWCRYLYSIRSYWHFFRNSRWRQPLDSIVRLCEFGHSGVLIVWYLCCVPNLVQISVTVTEIDALILQTLIRWLHAN